MSNQENPKNQPQTQVNEAVERLAHRGEINVPPDAPTTTNSGAPIASDDHSLTQGQQGPIVLHDYSLIEKLSQFERERVPERTVHAKGSGAFGEFVVTDDVSKYTCADFLQPGKRTPMLARFSSVAGEQGSPDTWRDPRGFALKFYTNEGNYDLVGNNTPVFFMRDPMKFPDFIHSQKRLADSGLRSNDMQWDYFTNSPESAHQVAWLFGDRGIPSSYRHMDGFSSHTYQWINADNEPIWVKYHFKTEQGNDFLTQAEADALAGSDPDYFRKDLHDAIEEGNYPSWTLSVQLMPTNEAEGYHYNPFDVTKVWSHHDYPLIEVGKFTLYYNPENYFAQIEQAAFEPSNLVRGIGLSPDKMLLGRVYSYPDAHRYRIGTNYQDLPINRPLNPPASYSKEGAMRYSYNNPKTVVYAPNSHRGPKAVAELSPGILGTWDAHGTETQHGDYVHHIDDDDWSQAQLLVQKVMDQAQRDRLVTNVSGHLLNGVSEPVLERAFEYWKTIDPSTGSAIEHAVREAQ